MLRYDLGELEAFDYVVGPDFGYLGCLSNFVQSHAILPSFLGVRFPMSKWDFRALLKKNKLSYSDPELSSLKNNSETLSTIVSTKRNTLLQNLRHEFLEYVENNSGLKIQAFGFGREPVSDKLDILKTSRFHLAFENSQHFNYMSEKLFDAVCAQNHVFYLGAPNVHDYFSRKSVTLLSADNFEANIGLMVDIMAEGDSFFPTDLDIRNYQNCMALEPTLAHIIRTH